jgi:hypothetical protein
MADIARLGLEIDHRQGEQAVRTVDQLTASAKKAEQAVGSLSRATQQAGQAEQQRAQQVATAARRHEEIMRASAERQRVIAAENGRKQALAHMEALERQFRADQATVREHMARGFLTPAQAREAGRLNAIAYNEGMIRSIDQAKGAGGLRGADGQAAYVQLAGSLKNVTEEAQRTTVATRGSRAGFGELRESAASLAAQMAGVHPIFGRLTNVIGSFAMGSAMMVGVLAGVAALGWAWQKIMAPINEAKKAAQEALATLNEVRDAKYNNLTRKLDVGLTEGYSERDRLRKEVEFRSALVAGTGSTGYNLEQLQKAQREYAEISARIIETERERSRVLREAAQKTADEFRKAEEDRARAAKEASAKIIAAAKEEQEALNELMAQRQRQMRVDLARSRSGATVQTVGGGTGGLVNGPALSADAERAAAEAGLVASKAALVMRDIWTEAVRGVQQTMAQGFARIFRDGLDGFRSFGASVVDLFRNVAAQIAAALAVKKLGLDKALAELSGTGGIKGAWNSMSGLGQVATVVGAGAAVFSTISGLVGKLTDSLFGHARKMREASEIVAENMRRMSASVAEARRSFGLSTPFGGGMDPLEGELRTWIAKLSDATFGGLARNGVPAAQLPLDEILRWAEELRNSGVSSDFGRLVDQYIEAVRRSGEEAAKAAEAEREHAAAISAAEEAARIAAENRRKEEEMRAAAEQLAQRQSAQDSLAVRRLGLGATSEESIRARAAILGGQELAEAQKLVAQGVYTTDMFRDLAGILEGELEQALREFRNSVDEAAKAAAAEADARRQREQSWSRDLDIAEAEAGGDTRRAERLRMNKDFDDFYNDLVKQGASAEILNRWLEVFNLRVAAWQKNGTPTESAAISDAMRTARSASEAETVRNVTGITNTSALRLVDVGMSQLSVMQSIDRKMDNFTLTGAGGTVNRIEVNFNAPVTVGDQRALKGVVKSGVLQALNEGLGREQEYDERLAGTAA